MFYFFVGRGGGGSGVGAYGGGGGGGGGRRGGDVGAVFWWQFLPVCLPVSPKAAGAAGPQYHITTYFWSFGTGYQFFRWSPKRPKGVS